VKKWASVNFLSNPQDERSALRPRDVHVYRWVGQHACMNFTGVSPLMKLRIRALIVGQTTLKTASSKVTKHEKASPHNQHAFIPFTI